MFPVVGVVFIEADFMVAGKFFVLGREGRTAVFYAEGSLLGFIKKNMVGDF